MKEVLKIKITSLLFVLLISLNLPQNNKQKRHCDRGKARIVRKFIAEKIRPIFKKFQKDIPVECPFNKFRDVFAYQEFGKFQKTYHSFWTCSFCGQFFLNEMLLDFHFNQHHSDKINQDENAICLADFCDIVRCDYLYIKELIVRFDEFEESTSLQIWNSKIDNRKLIQVDFYCSIIDSNHFCTNSTNITKDELLSRFLHFKETQHFKCDKKLMRILRKQCESLVDMCVMETIVSLSDNEFISLKDALNKEMCNFLTCERYWNDSNSIRNITWKVQIYFIIILISAICIAFIVIYWFLYFSERKKFKQRNYHFRKDDLNHDIPADDEFIYVSYTPQLKQQFLQRICEWCEMTDEQASNGVEQNGSDKTDEVIENGTEIEAAEIATEKARVVGENVNGSENGVNCDAEPETQLNNVPNRIRKWSKFQVKLPESTIITSKVIQEICPDLTFLDDDQVDLSVKESRTRFISDSTTAAVPVSAAIAAPQTETAVQNTDAESVENSTIGVNRKVLIVNDDDIDLSQVTNVTPPRNPVTNVLFISNLVRPFTIKQLKDLLSRTGVIVENGFWTDKIKSKCYVQYETAEHAELTRATLHGVQWPVGNGKKLSIEYSTEQEMITVIDNSNEDVGQENSNKATKRSDKSSDYKKREIDDSFERKKVREWDVGKENINGHSRTTPSRDKPTSDRNSKRRRSRHRSPDADKSVRKHKKKEDTPVKHMDDLFKKTKATPCIYWLPLNDEIIAKKEQERIQRLERHKKRREEAEDRKGKDKDKDKDKSRSNPVTTKHRTAHSSSVSRPKD